MGLESFKNIRRILMIAASVSLFSTSLILPASADSNKKAIALIPSLNSDAVVSEDDLNFAKKQRNPRGKKSHYEIGMALSKKGEKDAALLEFMEAGQENPEEVRAFFEQAKIFREKGHTRLAQDSLEKALSADPGFGDARVLLATIYLETGRLGDAANQLGQALGLTKQTKKAQRDLKKKIADNKKFDNQVAQGLGITPSVIQIPHGAMTAPEYSQPKSRSKNKNRRERGNADRNIIVTRKIPTELSEQTTENENVAIERNPNVNNLLKDIPNNAEKSSNGMWDKLVPKFSFGLPNVFGLFKGPKKDEVKEVQPVNTAKKKQEIIVANAEPEEEIDSEPAMVVKQPPPVTPPLPEPTALVATAGKINNNIAVETNMTDTGNIFVNKTPYRDGWLLTNAVKRLSKENEVKLEAMSGLPDDKWTERMKYLVTHGTATLSRGEAFMFSEESGEGVLFLSDGQSIVRKIALPRDRQELIASRRPDILMPKELRYSLSLLGTLLPKKPEENNNKTQPITGPSVDELLAKSSGFWSWIKNAISF